MAEIGHLASPRGGAGRWEAWWRERVEVEAPKFVLRRVAERRPDDLRRRVAAEAADAYAGEVRLVVPGGGRLWTDLLSIERWNGEGLPEECRRGLWREEERRLGREGEFLKAVDDAVDLGIRLGVLLPHDAAGIIAYAENGARMAALPASLRKP